jgi:hypothetical protein
MRRMSKHPPPCKRFLQPGENGWGADYKEIEYPPGSFDGCNTMPDSIRRARQLRMEHEKREAATRNREPA